MPIWCGEGIVSAITMVSRERIPPAIVVDSNRVGGPGIALHDYGFRDNPGCSWRLVSVHIQGIQA